MKITKKLFVFLFLISGLHACSSTNTETKLIVLSTTDIHGHVFPWNYYANEPDEAHSMLKAATIVDSIRSIHSNTLLFDAGDWLQGNPFAEFFAREDVDAPYPLIEAANFMKYDAFVVGNHEFNFGIELLNKRITQAGFPILGGNVIDASTGLAAYTPYIIKEIDGFSVAIIGLTTPGSAIWDRPRVEGKLIFEDGVDFGRIYVDEVRELGAEVIIMLIHSGVGPGSSYTSETVPEENFGQRLVDEIPGIDLVIAAHSHRLIENTKLTGPANPEGVPVIMAGRWASHVGLTELLLSRDSNGKAVVSTARNIAIPVVGTKVHEEIYEKLVDTHVRVKEFVNEPVASTNSNWNASDGRIYDRPIIDLIQHVQMAVTGADISLASVFNPSVNFGPGEITRRDLAGLYPYENTLFVKRISGRDLRAALEFSARYFATTEAGAFPEPSGITPGFNFDVAAGVHYEMDLSQPVGQRIKNLRFRNREVRDDQMFTLAVNSYRAVGGGDFDMIANAEVIREIDTPVRALIENYLKERGSIEVDDVYETNWRILNLPE
jgi:2',3'-cyclic-nucleotide 2'-phosphodiesterase (5'-nucleotidase family)